MTYQINVNQSKIKDFLQIIDSLKNLGVITSFESINTLTKEGEPMTTDSLMRVLEISKQQVQEKKVVPSEQVHKMIQSWKKSN